MLEKVKGYLAKNETLRYFLFPNLSYGTVVDMVADGRMLYKDVVFERLSFVPLHLGEFDYGRLYTAALEFDVNNYYLFPLEVRLEENIIIQAINQSPDFFKGLPYDLQNNLRFIYYAWKKYPDTYPEFKNVLKKTPAETLELMWFYSGMKESFNLLLDTKEERWLWADILVNMKGALRAGLPQEFYEDREWCLIQIERKKMLFENASEKLRNDPYFVYKVFYELNASYKDLSKVIEFIGKDLIKSLDGQPFFEGLKNLASRDILSEKYKDISSQSNALEGVL